MSTVIFGGAGSSLFYRHREVKHVHSHQISLNYLRIEDHCSKLQGIFDRKECGLFYDSLAYPPQAAGNALAFAVQKFHPAINPCRAGILEILDSHTLSIAGKRLPP